MRFRTSNKVARHMLLAVKANRLGPVSCWPVMGPATAILLTLVTAWGPAPPVAAQDTSGRILSRDRLARDGLTRAWLTQLDVDRSRDRVTFLTLHQGWLFAQTELGIVEVLDAATGRPIWTEPVGEPQWPTLPLSASSQFVAVLNGTRLHLLRRDDGRMIVSQTVGGVPSAGPTLTAERVYLPTMRGLIESWSLPLDRATTTQTQRTTQRRQTPWHHHSVGRCVVPLLATPEGICWPTQRGYLYVADQDSRKVLYRIELTDAINAPLAYRKETIYVATIGGSVYAVNEQTGSVRWSFVTGAGVTEPLIVLENRLYVATRDRGIFSLDADTGRQAWRAGGAAQFVAASRDRIYAADASNRLLILDIKSGARLGILPTVGLPLALTNRQTDRIFLGTRSGLLSCLHETALATPVRHISKENEGQQKKEKAAKEGQAAKKTGKPAPGKAPPPKVPAPKKRPRKAPPEENPFG